MNIRPVDKDFFWFTSKYGNRKLVIEIDGDCTKDELCDAFADFLNASRYSYTDHIECISEPRGAEYEPASEEDIPF